MEYNSCISICRFCLEMSDSNFETIEEVTFANLDFLWLKLNLSVSEEPAMCGDCAKTIRICLDFKTKCLELENYIVSCVEDKDSSKIDLREVYVTKMPVDDIVIVPEDHIVCRLCLELVRNDSAIFLRNSIDIAEKLEQYFPELDLPCTENPVICASCQVSLQRYFSFINNCLATEEKIMKYCKVEGTNSKGLINLNKVIYFISKDFGKCKLEVGTVKIEEMCNEVTGNASYNIEIKKEENLEMELDVKEDSSAQESQLIDENSYLSKASQPEKLYKCDYETKRNHIDVSEIEMHKCEACPFLTKCKRNLREHVSSHKNTPDVVTRVIYKYDLCDYKTKWNSNMGKHLKTHKTPLEITMYKCALCDYEAKWKSTLKRHNLIHKSPSEIIMYKCALCNYEAKWKSALKRHILTNKTHS